MKEIIMEKYNDLKEDLYTHYNKVKVIDDYDYYESNPYTIFYLNNKDNFEDFKKLWCKNIEQCREKDYSYDDILDSFYAKARDRFDYIELGTLDIYTDSEYELDI